MNNQNLCNLLIGHMSLIWFQIFTCIFFVGLSHGKQKYWRRSEDNSRLGEANIRLVWIGHWIGKAICGYFVVRTSLIKSNCYILLLACKHLNMFDACSFHLLIFPTIISLKVHVENEVVNRSEGGCHTLCLHVTWSWISKNCYSWFWWFGKPRATTWRNI